MNKLRKQIALGFVALFATMCVFSSCSEEEECMIDDVREQKVQELLRVSRALADEYEIGLCFTESMIRGGIDTLTVEDLRQAYEVYAANTVEIYVCKDSVNANENGLKLSRSSRILRETVTLQPGDGGTIIEDYTLTWTPQTNRLAVDYSGLLRMRIDWGYYFTGCTPYFMPYNAQAGGVPVVTHPLTCSYYYDSFESVGPIGNLVFEGECQFDLQMDGARCSFVVWAKETVYTRVMRLTLIGHTSNSPGSFTLSNDGDILYV